MPDTLQLCIKTQFVLQGLFCIGSLKAPLSNLALSHVADEPILFPVYFEDFSFTWYLLPALSCKYDSRDKVHPSPPEGDYLPFALPSSLRSPPPPILDISHLQSTLTATGFVHRNDPGNRDPSPT